MPRKIEDRSQGPVFKEGPAIVPTPIHAIQTGLVVFSRIAQQERMPHEETVQRLLGAMNDVRRTAATVEEHTDRRRAKGLAPRPTKKTMKDLIDYCQSVYKECDTLTPIEERAAMQDVIRSVDGHAELREVVNRFLLEEDGLVSLTLHDIASDFRTFPHAPDATHQSALWQNIQKNARWCLDLLQNPYSNEELRAGTVHSVLRDAFRRAYRENVRVALTTSSSIHLEDSALWHPFWISSLGQNILQNTYRAIPSGRKGANLDVMLGSSDGDDGQHYLLLEFTNDTGHFPLHFLEKGFDGTHGEYDRPESNEASRGIAMKALTKAVEAYSGKMKLSNVVFNPNGREGARVTVYIPLIIGRSFQQQISLPGLTQISTLSLRQ